MKYYLIAGEASGDLHASNLMKEIRKSDPDAVFRCWGGDLMKSEGGELVKHFRDLAYMGFIEVALNIRTIMKNIRLCKQDILSFQPDAMILIDYPGFNLRIAEFAHRKGLKVFYYISPQLWAWKKNRVYSIKRNVDSMFVILPFEKAFYGRYGYEVEFVGHPLLDVIPGQGKYRSRDEFILNHQLTGKPIIAVLPGSRKQEISKMLPIMVSSFSLFPHYEFVIAAAPSVDDSCYFNLLKGKNIRVITGETHEILRYAEAAIVTSGTATLETALFGVPEVVCYKGSNLSYMIAKRLVDVKYISLVNLIMDRQVVKELIQYNFTTENIQNELHKILNPEHQVRMRDEFRELAFMLGGPGASVRTADRITNLLAKK